MSVKSSNEKSLAIIKPNIAKEWHPTKNGDLTPHNVSSGSAKKYGGNVLKEMIMSG